MAYAFDMQLCSASIDEPCGTWSPGAPTSSAQIDAASFWADSGSNGD